MTSGQGFAYLAALPRERTYLLPAFHLVQEHEGYVAPEALAALSRHLRVPNSELYGIARSYSELRFERPAGTSVQVCTGLSCLLNGAGALFAAVSTALGGRDCQVSRVPCRFLCNLAPVVAVAPASGSGHGYVTQATAAAVAGAVGHDLPPVRRPIPGALVPEVRRVTARCGEVDPESIASARDSGSYLGLEAAWSLAPPEAVARVLASGLQGRGGAYFPTGRKWETAGQYRGPRLLVVNAEEGEPGVFKDRYLLENDPHQVLEGILIAAYAIEAVHVFVYLNGEAELAATRLHKAIEAAAAAGLCAPPDAGRTGSLPLQMGRRSKSSEGQTSSPAGPVTVEIRRGGGGYVCGEESVILSSIEGERAVPRLRPPLPVESGLWGRPTVINNVETLANLPLIFREGVDAFRSVGPAAAPGTKVLCLSGAVQRPGVYEVPLGTKLGEVLSILGGGPRPGRTLRAALCGGPSGGLMPESRFETPLLGGSLDAGGAALGAGGIVAIDDSMPIADVVHHLAAYNAAESCGKCTPCREGAPRMRDLLASLRDGTAPGDAVELLDALDETMANASLCGLGQMAPLPYRSARMHFLAELGPAVRE